MGYIFDDSIGIEIKRGQANAASGKYYLKNDIIKKLLIFRLHRDNIYEGKLVANLPIVFAEYLLPEYALKPEI